MSSLLPQPSTTPRMSSSRMMRCSSPSILISDPEYFPNRILSPTLTSRGVSLPSSFTLPLPTAITLPCCGFSLAVEKTKGGIIIPDTAKEKPQQGKVIAVGKGKVNDDGKLTPLDVKVGDKILFGKYSGSEIKIDGEEHLIMREEDILGVVEN